MRIMNRAKGSLQKYIIFTIILLFILVCSMVITGYFYVSSNFTYTVPANISFTINSGESIASISKNLKSVGAVKSSTFFYYYERYFVKENIEAGEYTLMHGMSLKDILSVLKNGQFTEKVYFYSGMRGYQIAEFVHNQDKNISISDFDYYFNNPSLFNYPFLSGVANLEGFLYPDTYIISPNTNAKSLISMILSNFNTKVYEKYSINNSSLSFYDLVKLASIVEKEANSNSDKLLATSVLLNRLNLNMTLGTDTTIMYYNDTQNYSQNPNNFTWWSPNISQSELLQDEPYNLRINTGLPPTPISSISATDFYDCLNSPKSNYLYFVSDSNGVLHFATSLQGHLLNIQKYASSNN